MFWEKYVEKIKNFEKLMDFDRAEAECYGVGLTQKASTKSVKKDCTKIKLTEPILDMLKSRQFQSTSSKALLSK